MPALQALEKCRTGLPPQSEEKIQEQADEEKPTETIQVPILGEVALDEFSLPAFTLVIAGLDAFNPCAFFILLFLLIQLSSGWICSFHSPHH